MRKNYFIKPYLQVRFIIFMTLITLLTVFFIYLTFELSITQVFENMGISIAEIKASLVPMRLYTLGVLGVILIAVGTLTVLYFHSFVGPLYSLERSLEKIKEGDLTGSISVRKDDQLKELAAKITHMTEFFKEHIRSDREKAQKISKTLEKLAEYAKQNKLTSDQIDELISCQKESSEITSKFIV